MNAGLSQGGGHGIGRHEVRHRPGQAALRRRLQAALEAHHRGRFVAIEPESGEHFLADTLDEAVRAARTSTRTGCRTPSGSGSPRPSLGGRPVVTGHSRRPAPGLGSGAGAASRDGPRREIVAWVDTAFNGGLTIPRALIDGLGLPQESSIEAVLADGRTVALETFGCYLDWFGGTTKRRSSPATGRTRSSGRCCCPAAAGHRLPGEDGRADVRSKASAAYPYSRTRLGLPFLEPPGHTNKCRYCLCTPPPEPPAVSSLTRQQHRSL